MIRYFDAFTARSIKAVQYDDDEYGLYAAGRRNNFGTSLAARGTKGEIRHECLRVAPTLVGEKMPRALR